MYIRSKTFLVEGIYTIENYSDNEVVLKIKDKKLIFIGKNFSIIKSSRGEIVLSGVVLSFCIE